jgi:Uma2 family endonuclease
MQPPTILGPDQPTTALPDHTQLPDEDGTFVHNFQEYPQTNLLTESVLPRLRERHPDDQFCIGNDCGIYWRSIQPPLDGCKAPDWFYVPGVPPMLDGELRRSYVLWKEVVHPLLIVEFVSGDGSEERDSTPFRGKFWVYEQAVCAPYYAIYEVEKGTVELFKLNGGKYHLVVPNEAGRLAVEPLGVELGIWRGTYRGMDLPWLRVWDAATGLLLPTAEELLKAERQLNQEGKQRAETAESLLDDTRRRLEEECERAENERKRAEKLAQQLRALGGDPDAP